MLKIENNKYLKICDNCGKIDEIKLQSYKNNILKQKHYCRGCNQRGEKNPMFGKKCWNKGLTKETDERVKLYNEKQSITKKGKEPWNKGLTKETDERVLKYTNTMSNNRKGYFHTLQYFIDRYGEETGLEEYERLNSTKALTPQNFINKYGEQQGIEKFEDYLNNAHKPNNFYSKSSQQLFWLIYNTLTNKEHIYFAELNKEYGKMSNNQYYFYDFVDTENKKVIEFNGDVFHANPNRYSADDTPNPYNKQLTAKQIWEHDVNKTNFIETLGFDVLIIWESDFYDNKQLILNKCISFLKGE